MEARFYVERVRFSIMMENSYTLWIEAENWAEGEWDEFDSNTDVIVQFEDTSKWIASFFTYNNINTIVEKNKKSGECLQGKYYWSSDMILVQKCSRHTIEEVVNHLIKENMFSVLFRRIHPIDLENESVFTGRDWTELSVHFGLTDEKYVGENDDEILERTKEFLQSIITSNREKEVANDIREFLKLLYQTTEGYKESASIWKGMLEMEHDFNLIKYTKKLLDCMSM